MRSLLVLPIIFFCSTVQAFFVNSYSIQPEFPVEGEDIRLSIEVCSGSWPGFEEYVPTFNQNSATLMFLMTGIAPAVPGCDDIEVQLPPGLPGSYTISIGFNYDIIDTLEFHVHGLGGPEEATQSIPASSNVTIVILSCLVLLIGFNTYRFAHISPRDRQ